MTDPFTLSVAILADSISARDVLTRALLVPTPTDTPAKLGEGFASANEGIRFNSHTMENADELVNWLKVRLSSKRACRVVVVSDNLVHNEAGQQKASALANEIRGLFNSQTTHLLGLVALVVGEPGRLTDIDEMLDPRTLSLAVARPAMLRVAYALWLKSVPSAQRKLRKSDAVKVRLVRSLEELKMCLRLRFLVYGALGYLEKRIAHLANQMELDTYDQHSLHLCAVERASMRVVGTLRMVLCADRRRASTVDRRAPDRLALENACALSDVVRMQAVWIRRIANEEPILHNKLREENPLTPLPIMDNTDFGDLWPQFLQDYDYRETAEISRVIVSPDYRGLGVSALLMRSATAAAAELRVRHLLLECIPTHVRMYQQYGFEPLPRRHCRARELDQFAVGMRLEMETMPPQTQARLQGDLRMLRLGLEPKIALLGSRGLCLCRQSECWKEAQYGGWGGKACPLVKDMPVT